MLLFWQSRSSIIGPVGVSCVASGTVYQVRSLALHGLGRSDMRLEYSGQDKYSLPRGLALHLPIQVAFL